MVKSIRTVLSSCVQLTSNPGFEIEGIMAEIKEGLANKEKKCPAL